MADAVEPSAERHSPTRPRSDGSPSRVAVHCRGAVVAVEGPAHLLAAILADLPWSAQALGGVAEAASTVSIVAGGDAYDVYSDADHVGSSDGDGVVSLAIAHLQTLLAAHFADVIAVHAGCVSVAGRAIVVPGRSFTGKSTLTHALVLAGATYLSDEYALFDGDGIVHPFPRPIRLRDADGGFTAVRVEDGPGVPVPVGLIAAVRHDEDCGLDLVDISPGAAVLELLANAVPGRVRPTETLDALTAAARRDELVCCAGTRGGAEEAAAALIARLTGARR
jgi:hypothetical protein